ncbi:MAG TPA: peptide-methionine (S)-S-oxide reductase MsrA [Burkholderiaceae bacterium]|nr:peptide-methionine (S)-S-oxide reductase MsrA [Burkholderiaceae bacterium]
MKTAGLWILGALCAMAVWAQDAPAPQTETATFAGGCFWCVEADFDKIDGVISTTSGYMGGRLANPSYQQVSAGQTGHAEVVQVVFDPARVSYSALVERFWRTIDPTVKDRQFCDVGSQYRSAIFTHDARQQQVALASKKALEHNKPFPDPILTDITPASTFYPAESDHQDYYQKNPIRYRYYRFGCGRDARLEALWGPSAK